VATDSSTHPALEAAPRVPALRAALAPLALALLTLGLILAGGAVARPGAAYSADDPLAGRALVRFYGVERNETDAYRWSEPLAGAFLYGYDGRPAIATLRLAAPRPAGEPPATVRASAAGLALGSFPVGGGWRRYHVLAPTDPAAETALLLETAPYVPEGDPRELGVALSHVRLEPAGAARGVPPVRALYLLALPLIGWLLLTRLRAPAWAALGLGGLLALAAGWAAANPTAGGYWLPTLGWPWWLALALLLLAAWPRLAPALAAARTALDARPALGWAGLAVALAAVAGMRLGLPWPLGMVLLAAGTWAGLSAAAGGAAHAERGAAWDRAVPLLLLGVLGAALLLRLVGLDGQPAGLWRDESRHGLQALRIWTDPEYRPIYVVEGADLPALLFYLMAPVVGVLGPHAWSARLVSALAGALTPLALYWAGAPLVGRRAALIGAALLAWASWALSMSRWAFPATLDHALVLAAVGLVWRCAPGRGWRAVGGMALAGLLGGLAVYAYHTGRVAPLALGAVAALRLGPDARAWRRAAPGLAAAAIAGALVIAPLAIYILSDLDGYNRRVGSVSILDSNDPRTHTPAGLLLGNLGRYLLMFHVQGDGNGRHHMPGAPMLDPLAGLALALGLALAVRRLLAARNPGPQPGPGGSPEGLAAVLALGAVYLIPGVFSGNAPHAMRSLGTLAPAMLLAGVGLAAVFDAVASRTWGRSPQGSASALPAALCAGALALSLAFNVWLYFGAMRVEPRVYGEFDLLETALGRVAAAPAASADPALRAVRVYLPAKLLGEDTTRFLTWGAPSFAYTGAPLPADGPALILLPGDASAAAQAEALAALGPGAAPLGAVASYPGTDTPVALAFGRGAAAARLLEKERR
jgi:hypothetical protein